MKKHVVLYGTLFQAGMLGFVLHMIGGNWFSVILWPLVFLLMCNVWWIRGKNAALEPDYVFDLDGLEAFTKVLRENNIDGEVSIRQSGDPRDPREAGE